MFVGVCCVSGVVILESKLYIMKNIHMGIMRTARITGREVVVLFIEVKLEARNSVYEEIS